MTAERISAKVRLQNRPPASVASLPVVEPPEHQRSAAALVLIGCESVCSSKYNPRSDLYTDGGARGANPDFAPHLELFSAACSEQPTGGRARFLPLETHHPAAPGPFHPARYRSDAVKEAGKRERCV